MPPPLLKLADEAAYRQHFHENYCTGAIMTHDGIPTYFDRWKFDHAFFESVTAKDDTFSLIRAERMDWIRITLQDVTADRFQGWNKKTKTYLPHRRVEVVHEDFVVVLQISRKRNGRLKAKFVTCYQADNSIGMIRQSPAWDRVACENALP